MGIKRGVWSAAPTELEANSTAAFMDPTLCAAHTNGETGVTVVPLMSAVLVKSNASSGLQLWF